MKIVHKYSRKTK